MPLAANTRRKRKPYVKLRKKAKSPMDLKMQVYRRTSVWAFTAQSKFSTVIMTRGCTVVNKKSVESYIWFDFFCH